MSVINFVDEKVGNRMQLLQCHNVYLLDTWNDICGTHAIRIRYPEEVHEKDGGNLEMYVECYHNCQRHFPFGSL